MAKSQSWFTRMAMAVSKTAGEPYTFVIVIGVVVVWAINTGTTIITFLMVFLIQNSQNRDTEALQIKLDELINALHGTNEALLDLEQLDEKELDKIRKVYLAKATDARRAGRDERRKGSEDADDGTA